MNFIKILSNLPGWRTERKIIVIESDDWGSIRMPSLQSFEALKKEGVSVDKGDSKRFNTLDTLASKEDFETLFSTLSSFKDKKNNHPVITAMALSANPDFKKIEEEQFSQYYYQTISETLIEYKQEDAFCFLEERRATKVICT
jgi:hypothetical protein